MHRLLQGDVGAGKTIVALLAAIVAMENGLQVAFMAPTEILAEQHYANIARLLAASRFRVDLLTGSTPRPAEAHVLVAHRARQRRNLVVGTHALVQEHVTFHKLGLVIIDEQHRFGVAQRADAAREGTAPGRAAHDRDADSAHAGADRLQRSRRVEDSGPAAGAQAGPNAGQAGVAARRDLRS